MFLAYLQLLETSSKVSPSVADKVGLELPFNFHFLIKIKNPNIWRITSLLVLIFYIKPKR